MNKQLRKSFTQIFLVLLLASPLCADVATPDRLVPPGGAHFTGAWIPEDGPALVAWESTETGRSGLLLYEDGERSREWVFDDLLIKDARWLVSGETLRLGVVVAPGRSETRIYALRDGELRLLGSTAALEREWDRVSLSADCRRWVAARFGSDVVDVAAGDLGDETPTWTWRLAAEDTGPASSGAIEELSRAAFVTQPGGGSTVALLWNGHLWLADVESSRRTALRPPGDCDSVQNFTVVEDGLWAQCFRGVGKEPPGLWGYYPAMVPGSDERPAARTLAAFRKPWFRSDGTVIDVDRRLGEAEVHTIVPGAAQPAHLGTLELPERGARYIPAGDALLQAIAGTEQLRVVTVGRKITELQESAARNAGR